MVANCLDIITRITVELHKDSVSKEKLGTGVIYTHKRLSGTVYVLTAKHCLTRLSKDEKVTLRVFNPNTGTYEYVTPVKQNILLHPIDDAGVIVFNQRELTSIISNLPSIYVIDKNVSIYEAVTKGFPVATLDQTSEYGESSLAMLRMNYLQDISNENVFQLSTIGDYSEIGWKDEKKNHQQQHACHRRVELKKLAWVERNAMLVRGTQLCVRKP